METLDTEKASYIRHTERDRTILIEAVGEIEKDLQLIREKGREVFWESTPEAFSRVFIIIPIRIKGSFLGRGYWKSW